MKHLLTILRPVNGLMSAIAVYIASLVAGAEFVPSFAVMVGMLVTFLISGAGMVINDIFDVKIDKVNRPERPLPSGKMSIRNAWMYCALLFVVGNALAFVYLPINAFYFALLASVILAVYNAALKKVMMVGHVAVSFLVGLSFIFGGAIMGNTDSVMILAGLAFLANTGREVYKTIDDALGDGRHGVNTIAIRYGAHRARLLGNAFVIIAVLLSAVPYLSGTLGLNYLYLVVIADVLFIAAAVAPVKHSSKLTKIAMNVALLAFIAGAF